MATKPNKDILIKREIANLAKLFKAKLPMRDYDVHTTFSMKASDRYNKVRQLVQSSDLFSRKVINTFKITGDIDLSRKQNIVFKFKTDSSREDLLQQIISALGSRDKKIEIPHKYSTIGGVILNVSDTIPIPFHFLVKYKDPNAFRYLKYTNALLEDRNWDKTHTNRTPDTSEEQRILKKLNDGIYELGDKVPVTIKIGNKIIPDFIGFIPGKTGSHADFVGLNKKLKEVCFISHKKGNNAKSFQQYSGITSRAGKIHTHSEVVDFRKEIVDTKTEQDFRSMAYYRHIKDNNLKGMAVFGEDYGSGNEGMNNVTFFCQGNLALRKQRRRSKVTDQCIIHIRFSTKNVPQSSLGSLTYRGYKPTLGARKGEATRRIEHGGKSLSGIRGGVYTESYIVTARTSEPI
jgi:hypothetical protein